MVSVRGPKLLKNRKNKVTIQHTKNSLRRPGDDPLDPRSLAKTPKPTNKTCLSNPPFQIRQKFGPRQGRRRQR